MLPIRPLKFWRPASRRTTEGIPERAKGFVLIMWNILKIFLPLFISIFFFPSKKTFFLLQQLLWMQLGFPLAKYYFSAPFKPIWPKNVVKKMVLLPSRQCGFFQCFSKHNGFLSKIAESDVLVRFGSGLFLGARIWTRLFSWVGSSSGSIILLELYFRKLFIKICI